MKDAHRLDHLRLVHELEVHQIELEVQNDALREGQSALVEAHGRYAELYDSSPVGHVTLDVAGTIEALNLTGAALLGKDRQFLVGRPLGVLLEPESQRVLRTHVRDVLGSNGPSRVELDVPLPGGERRTVELVSLPPPQRAGRSTAPAFHSAIIDVSERRRQDEQREELLRREREARALAESASRIKEDFLAVVSDELRSSLAPMQLWIGALRGGNLSEGLHARAVEAIDTCLQAQLAVIDELLEVARAHQGTLRVERRAMELAPVVSDAAEAVAPSAAARQIVIRLDVAPAPVWIAGDPARLRQVVTTLLANAVRATADGGQVALSLHERASEVVLTVSDDGEGLEPEQLAEVFEPFPGQARVDGGWPARRGFGLAVVQQLVARHDGRVTAASDGRGRGSRFTIRLPRLAEAAAPPRRA